MVKKKRLFIAGIIVLLVLTALTASFDFRKDNGSVVMPIKGDFDPENIPFPYGNLAAELDLSQKNLLSLTRYGFRQKVKFEKVSLVGLCLEPDIAAVTPYNGLKYGIYYDEALEDPVEEIDLQQEMNKELAAETSLKVGEPKRSITVEVEPGTYYVAVYTNHFWDAFKISFLRYYIER